MTGPSFYTWGCRGSRNLPSGASLIGSATSCYSFYAGGPDLYVLDAGHGLGDLSAAVFGDVTYANVRRIHVFLTHCHLDHVSGLKDAAWFWRKDNGLSLTLYGPAEALQGIQRLLTHPVYVPLDLLAQGTLAAFSTKVVRASEPFEVGEVVVTPHALHHYAGSASFQRQYLETLGYHLCLRRTGTPTPPRIAVAYLCDHEPTKDTLSMEEGILEASNLVLYDAHFLRIAEQTFGHGSVEHAANMAQRFPNTLVVGGHHSGGLSDEEITQAYAERGRDTGNFLPAVERNVLIYQDQRKGFARIL